MGVLSRNAQVKKKKKKKKKGHNGTTHILKRRQPSMVQHTPKYTPKSILTKQKTHKDENSKIAMDFNIGTNVFFPQSKKKIANMDLNLEQILDFF